MQCGIFGGAYVGNYSSVKGIGWISVLAFAVLVPWAVILWRWNRQLSKLWIVWTVYVLVLAIFICVIFGWLREKLDKKNFWGPNNLKITVCMTPVIAIVLIATAKDSQKYGDLVHRFYGGLVLELFDAIEVLAIAISLEDVANFSSTPGHFNSSSNYSTSRLPNGLAYTIIAFGVLSLLLSPQWKWPRKNYMD